MEKAIRCLCDCLSANYDDILRKTNNHSISMNRNYIYYILHYDCKYSVGQIAKFFSRSRREISYRLSEMRYRIEYFGSYRCTYDKLYEYAFLNGIID